MIFFNIVIIFTIIVNQISNASLYFIMSPKSTLSGKSIKTWDFKNAFKKSVVLSVKKTAVVGDTTLKKKFNNKEMSMSLFSNVKKSRKVKSGCKLLH